MDAQLSDNDLRILAAAFAVAGAVVALLYLGVVRFLQGRMRNRDPNTLAGAVIGSQSALGALLFLYLGVYVALLLLPELEGWRDQISRGGVIGFVAIGAMGVNRVGSALIVWYATSIARKTESHFDDLILRILGRFLRVFVWGIAGLIALDTLGVSISPLLGGLGITGIAVALALQPTLGNIFAGAYVLSEGAIEEGDYIELQGGPAGYVVNIGWRSTTIRTWLNNYVIIPNSVMSSSTITNYSGPDPRMSILVTCGVSYDSDLEQVNRVALEVARETILANPDAVQGEEPWFGFDRFGDSNVDFWIFLRATSYAGSFVVTSDLIKRLHARFLQDGIEINYPVRKLVYDAPAPPGPAQDAT